MIAESGHMSQMTHVPTLHAAVEASVLVGDTGDDDGDGAATSSPHVFPTSLARCALSLASLALPGHVT